MENKLGFRNIALIVLAVAAIVAVFIFAFKGDNTTKWVKNTNVTQEATSPSESSGPIEATAATQPGGTQPTEDTFSEYVDFGNVYLNGGTYTVKNDNLTVTFGGTGGNEALEICPVVTDGPRNVVFGYYPMRGSVFPSKYSLAETDACDYGAVLSGSYETVWRTDGSWKSETVYVGIRAFDADTVHVIGLYLIEIHRNADGFYSIYDVRDNEVNNRLSDYIKSVVGKDIADYCSEGSFNGVQIDSVLVEPLASQLYSHYCTGIFGSTKLYSDNIISYPVYAANVNFSNSAFGNIVFYYCTVKDASGQPSADYVLPLGYKIG